MWRRRLGALLLRPPSSSSSTASSSCQRRRHHLLPSEEPLALNHPARLFTSKAGSDGGDLQKPFISFVLENFQIGAEPDVVIFFDCPEDEMVKRLLGRNQGRVDDNIETIKKRLKVFESLNIPVIDYYSSRGKVHKINATGTAEEIFEGVRKLFSNLRLSSSREPGVMLSNTHVLSMKTVPTLVRTQKVFSLYCSFTHVHLWHGNCRYTHGPHLQ